jgi:hypothetical protein
MPSSLLPIQKYTRINKAATSINFSKIEPIGYIKHTVRLGKCRTGLTTLELVEQLVEQAR